MPHHVPGGRRAAGPHRHHHPGRRDVPPPDPGSRPHRHHGRGRAQRGDVRTAVLLLLAEQPMHGYQLMQAIADRSGGRWTPSPGAIYPTISQLEDEGLVAVTADSGRKLVTLTEAGRAHVEDHRSLWSDPYVEFPAGGPGDDLRGPLEQLHAATRQIARAGSDSQRAAAARVLTDARRALYLLLADGGETADD